jgi:DnaK suppressor protein
MKRNSQRVVQLKHALARGRENLCDRVRALRRARPLETVSAPGDVMDLAKSLVDAETHASLIERAERQLAEIDYALIRLDDGEYGVCLDCGEEIPFERLKVIPSALYCVGCQSRDVEHGRSRGA